MDNHNVAHYVIAGLLAVGGTAGNLALSHRVDTLPAPHVARLAYAGLSDEQQSALTAALAKMGKHDFVLWCTSPGCADLSEDLQYVAYQAGWDTRAQTFSVYPLPKGVSVSPDNDAGHALARALMDSVPGLKVGFTQVNKIDAPDLSVTIGDK